MTDDTTRDLIEFLNACLDEDERRATAWGKSAAAELISAGAMPGEVVLLGVERLRTETRNKRHVIAEAIQMAERADGEYGCGHSAADIIAGKCAADGYTMLRNWLQPLALQYADRAGYRPEWRPPESRRRGRTWGTLGGDS